MPAQDRVQGDDGGDLGEQRAAELGAAGGEAFSFVVGEPEPVGCIASAEGRDKL